MTASVPTVGHHVLVELFGCDPSRTDDLDGVRATLLGAVQAIGATAVGEAFHRFSPQGVSGVVLIAESHLSCHTWPETGYVALDIYTCGQVDPHGAVEHLRQAFGAKTWLTQDVVRGLLEFAPETPVQRRSALFDRRRFHAPASPSRLHERREVLRAAGAVDVTGIVDAATFERVRDEVHRLVAAHAERRDLRLATTGDTRRSMSVVRSEEIAASPLIRELYTSRTLLDPLEQIAGERLHPCPSADEEFLITHQHQRGDTHGWHWGDYGYALIWILEAPPLPVGGSLQCVPHTRWNKQDPRVLEHLTEHPIETYHFSAGQTYLLKTDTTLHRTIPLRQDATRIILNMTWATDADLRRGLAGDDRWWEDASVSAAQALSSSDGASSEVSRVG